MPAKSKAQQEKFGAELARRRRGEAPQMPGLSNAQVEEFASTPRKGLPQRVRPRRKK